MKLSKRSLDILYLVDHYGPHLSDIMAASTYTRGTVSSTLHSLLQDRYVYRPQRAHYSLSESGREALLQHAPKIKPSKSQEEDQPTIHKRLESVVSSLQPIIEEHAKYENTLRDIRDLINKALGE